MVQVRIDQIDQTWEKQLVFLGVVTQPPDAITLPDWSGYLPSAVVVGPDWVMVNGVEVRGEHTHTHTHTHTNTHTHTWLDERADLHMDKKPQPPLPPW